MDLSVRAVVHIRRCCCAARLAVDPDAPFHAEEPLLVVPRLMHLGAARLVLSLAKHVVPILVAIHDRAGAHLQTVASQCLAGL
jgi:hypothetical protein